MSNFAPFIQVNLDYSLLQQAFDSINQKLKEHDQKFEEMNKIIISKTDNFDFLQYKNNSEQGLAKLNNEEQQMSEKHEKLNNNFENKITEIEQLLKNIQKETIENVKMELSAEGALPTTGERQGFGNLEDIAKRLEIVESKLQAAQRDTHTTDNTVQQIINQFAQLNQPQNLRGKQVKENTPIDSIKNTISTVNNKFDQLFNSLPTGNSSEYSARDFDGASNNENGESQNGPQNTVINNTTLLPHEISYPYEVDFSAMRPSPSTVYHINNDPELPPLHTFTNLSEPIEYIYELIPSLQAILIGLREGILNNQNSVENGGGVVTRDTIDNMYQKLASAMKELVAEVGQLKEEISKTASIDDVNAALASISVQDLPETAVGVVHCMTCGREMSQVAGALSYVDAVKTLGRAPTSYATKSKGISGLGMQFSGRNTFDSAICESPRSVKSSRASSNIKVTRK
ncbi:hypothetical protein TVAG_381880 [Trichomonas vaginalis G3]|uniref:Uncharacterized protein n=1 Tax=Trichomonas vaginalis (strain ATCC PRA-98 / G3) TaxID=412133 RepID=A2F291_TRIV3|nr:hypothetical protein TVAGG3_0496570 [Trichomonas vaginalis G3]EAY00970.1 hypothetical protein TVAG_381880 [Trichomonas vaginalis G3]KAI5516766.1 hypothetical protein TVAGG3_0496570 [Trichomonas vaginalis G3]|eukprot:XP_001313887.1 hypothetical protein [Trichomonas vaginalis G3]